MATTSSNGGMTFAAGSAVPASPENPYVASSSSHVTSTNGPVSAATPKGLSALAVPSVATTETAAPSATYA